MTPIDFIRTCPPFDQLTPAELDLIAHDAARVEIAAGTQILARDGTPSQFMYLIESGTVTLSRDGQVRQILEAGEIFGYSVLVRNESPAFDVVADDMLIVYRVSDTVCQQLIDNANFAAFFLQGLGDRLRIAATADAPPPQRNLATPVKQIMTRRLRFIAPDATVQEAAQLM